MLFVFALIYSLVATNAYYDDYDSYEGVGKLSLIVTNLLMSPIMRQQTTKIPLEKKHCHQQTLTIPSLLSLHPEMEKRGTLEWRLFFWSM